jgi:dCTP diphosphatase
MNDKTTTLCDLKKMTAEFVRQRSWEKYHRPKNLAMSIGIEAAELMELFQWSDHTESDAFLANAGQKEMIAHEMADVLAFLLSLANVTGIDLASSFSDKMKLNRKKYPAAKVKGHYKRPRKTRDPGL